MDWKYKHFRQERMYAAEREVVLDAARAYFADSLSWKVSDTAEGLIAKGSSFAHVAKANLRIQTAGAGTTLIIDLAIERAGATGFMLFDVGGYYSIQIRKWLDGVQWNIHQKHAPVPAGVTNPHLPTHNRTSACIFNALLAFIAISFGLYFVVQFISAVVGEITGTLYLWGRGGTLVLHGVIARVVSSLILLSGLFVVWQIRKKRARVIH